MSLLTEPVELRHRPEARDDRWQPTRAGIINLWRYWDETFTFHNGRLLLRGPNGSGKSMALELLLPFLLDGDASPAKLTSAAKSRGGLYERVMTGTTDTTRTGFAWIEFRRGDDTFTVGVRVRASSSTRSVTRSLFTTTQTIGTDLHLLDEARVPLARKALDEAIGEQGRVTDSATEHRDAIRSVLYPTFSADRYDALVNALLALRKEKLSQHLDLDKLDEVMSEALPAIDDHEIAAVAEGFERLDRRRDELTLLEGDVNEIESLGQRQRAYARAVIGALADEVRRAASVRDGIVRRQRLAADELAEVAETLSALDADDEAARDRLRTVGGELDGIKSSELYKEGAQLAQLRHDLDQRIAERDRLEEDLQQRRDDVAAATASVETADREVAAAAANEERARRELTSAAELAGAGSTVAEAVAGGHEEGASLLGAWVRERRVGLTEVRRLIDEHRRAVDRRVDAEARLETQRQRVDALTVERQRVAAVLETERAAFVDRVREWVVQSASLTEGWRRQIHERLQDPALAVDGVGETVSGIRSQHASEIAVARADVESRRTAVLAERTTLEGARSALEQGGMPVVDPPVWRSARDDDRDGGPLWQLVDIVDGTEDELVDRIESALVAAGVADAWVSPSGTFDLPEELADVALTTLGAGPAQTLADILRPARDTDRGVAASIVEDILSAVAVVDSATAVNLDGRLVIGTDGTFRVGSAVGRGAHAPGTLLGATARERHRRAEIERLTGLITECDDRLRSLEAEDAQLTMQESLFAADLDTLPNRASCDEAAAALSGAEVRLGEADANRRAAEDDVRRAEEAVRGAQRTLATQASARKVPSDEDGLSTFAAAVDDVERATGVWRRRADERATADKQHQLARDGLGRAARAEESAEARWRSAMELASVLSAKVEAIESTIGQDFGALLARVSDLESEEQTLEATREGLAARRPELDRRHGKLEAALATANEDLAAAEVSREEIHARFVDVWAGPLPGDAGLEPPPEPLDGVTAILTHARALATDLDGVRCDADEIDRLSLRVQSRLHDTKAAVGIRVDLERYAVDGGWHVVRGSTGGIRHGLVELRAHLRHQLAEARDELHAEEAALFERTLAGSIRHALADRIRGANALVAAINAHLSAVQTAAAGVAVRLRWDVDDDQPDAVRTARALLLRDPADLTDSEREALQDFVRARVDQARAELELHAPWEARLRESLDYRAWHRFSLQVSHRDWEGFKAATPRILQRLSTGERSVALHLPMLASIAAHYTGEGGAPGGGPRLILLDELFAGVDAANRAQLFGTFQAWDLDAVFTSDHEWCQYARLDGIAIHHLQGGRDDEPVTSTRFTWDGHERRLDDTTP